MARRDIAKENEPAALRHMEPVGNGDRRHAFVRAHSGARSGQPEGGRPERAVRHMGFTVTDEKATNGYDYGYQELLRYRDGRVIETLSLRRGGDIVHWVETPFVRIRRQQYLADLDGDGHLEFAVFPFSPGTAVWGTLRIYSLKEEIEPWGLGRLMWGHGTRSCS